MQTLVAVEILLPLIDDPNVLFLLLDIMDVEHEVAHALLVHHLRVQIGFAYRQEVDQICLI